MSRKKIIKIWDEYVRFSISIIIDSKIRKFLKMFSHVAHIDFRRIIC